MRTVQFVSAKPYLNVPDSEFDKLLYCMSGRREVVVLCDEELKDTLRSLPSDYYIPRLKDFKDYLKANGIEWTENLKGTTTV